MVVEVLANSPGVDGIGAEVLAPDLSDLRLGDQRAEGRGQSGVDRDDHLRHPHLGGDVGGVERSGAAEGDQGVLPGIETAIDGEHADGVGHVLVGDVDDRLRRLQAAQPEALPSSSSFRSAFGTLSWIAPPRKYSGFSRPRTRLASVTVTSSPPVS